MLGTVVHHCAFELIKKNWKIIPNNDVQLESVAKPVCSESDVLDKSIVPQKWKSKKPGDEQPALRDVFEQEQMKDAYSTGFNTAIVVDSQ